jgi:hypothetical protein
MARAWGLVGVALLASAIGFGLGYRQGVGKGAEALGSIAASNVVHGSLSELRMTLQGSAQADPASWRRLDEIRIHAALVQIGAYEPAVAAFWDCTKAQRETMGQARAYLEAHPIDSGDPRREFIAKGAAFCAATAPR